MDIELKEDGDIFVIKKTDIITPHLLISLWEYIGLWEDIILGRNYIRDLYPDDNIPVSYIPLVKGLLG